jgi:hypothetical protein
MNKKPAATPDRVVEYYTRAEEALAKRHPNEALSEIIVSRFFCLEGVDEKREREILYRTYRSLAEIASNEARRLRKKVETTDQENMSMIDAYIREEDGAKRHLSEAEKYR